MTGINMRIWGGAIALGLLLGLPVGSLSKAIAAELGTTQETLEIAQALTSQEQKQQLANRLLGQGLQQYRVSRFLEALQSFEASLALFRELSDRVGESVSLNNLGTIYDSQGQYAQALGRGSTL